MCPVITAQHHRHLGPLREVTRSGSLGQHSPVLWEAAAGCRANLACRPVPGSPIRSPWRVPKSPRRRPRHRRAGALLARCGDRPRRQSALATAVVPRRSGRSIRPTAHYNLVLYSSSRLALRAVCGRPRAWHRRDGDRGTGLTLRTRLAISTPGSGMTPAPIRRSEQRRPSTTT